MTLKIDRQTTDELISSIFFCHNIKWRHLKWTTPNKNNNWEHKHHSHIDADTVIKTNLSVYSHLKAVNARFSCQEIRKHFKQSQAWNGISLQIHTYCNFEEKFTWSLHRYRLFYLKHLTVVIDVAYSYHSLKYQTRHECDLQHLLSLPC